ncbi:unnamed protein product [Echinostoma caproni]|uniref:Uncharacterized protein n=1 Tax=Echinostoma caproni TaxID=27848 RepID=A0A3P8FNT3_9TREM|nr:unnamed protein product [Echinostoma caproni]
MANASTYMNSTSLTELSLSSSVDSSLRCSLPSPKAFRLLRGINDPDMPWLGFLLGQTPASIWYWCADQVSTVIKSNDNHHTQMMVQRALAAKSLSHAQGATLLAGMIKQLPLFIIVIPGMISRILFPGKLKIIPSGLRGLMLAVMSAALISDLTSIFNSASTLFAVDIYKRFRGAATDWELTLVGRYVGRIQEKVLFKEITS